VSPERHSNDDNVDYSVDPKISKGELK